MALHAAGLAPRLALCSGAMLPPRAEPPSMPASSRDRLRAAVLRRVPGARRGPPRDLGGHDVLGGSARPRILVVRPDHLGDVVLAGPALGRLRAALPGARVTLLVGPWSREVAALLPDVDALDVVPFPAFARGDRRGLLARYGPLLAGARRLRAARFDAALLLRDDDWWSAWMVALAGIPRRIGHGHAAPRPFLTHALAAAQAPPHVAAAAIALVDAALADPRPPDGPARDPLALRLADADHRAAAALLGPAEGERPLAVHPGSGSPIKRWHAIDWGEVVRALTAPGEPVVLTGGPGERDLAAAVARHLDRPVVDLAGRTDVATLAAVFARCRLVLGPDSGPLHLAVAVGTPTVHLYGPADPRRFGPWGLEGRHAVVASDLPCAPCGRLDWPDPDDHPCIRLLAPADVIAAARRVSAPPSP